MSESGKVVVTKAKLDELANRINEKAGSTGPKTIAELTQTVANMPSGVIPEIGANGNWYIDGVDTGKPSRGETGPKGATGPAGKTPVKGTDYFTNADKQELASQAAGLVDLSGKQDKITKSGLLKGDGAGGVSAAVPGTDYLTEAPVTSVNGATGEVKSTFYVTVTQGGGDNATADKTAEEVYAAHAAGYAVYAIAKFPALSPLPFMLPLVSAMSIDGNIGLGFSTLGSSSPTAVPQYPTVLYTGMKWKAWIGMLMRDPLNIQIGSTVTSYDGSYTVNVEIPEGVPSVTTADNGKFLRVVNGAWAAVEIANANGGSF